MISRKYETIVGLFVVVSLAAMFVVVLIIAQQERLWREHIKYQAVFKNVAGLKKGSEVRMAGVVVGNVTDVSIDPHGNVIVTFEVLEEYRDRIRMDSRVTIVSVGLLGDKSLEITAGTRKEKEIPSGGEVPTTPPYDFADLVPRVIEELENLKKLITAIHAKLTDPESGLNQAIDHFKEIAEKINKGEGTLGLLVNDPQLYQLAAGAMAGAEKFTQDLERGQGLLAALVHDPALRKDTAQILRDLVVIAANVRQVSADLKETTARLPDLVATGQGLVSEAEKVTKAAQKSFLLRRHVPQPQERTLRVEQEAGRN